MTDSNSAGGDYFSQDLAISMYGISCTVYLFLFCLNISLSLLFYMSTYVLAIPKVREKAEK